MKFKSYILPVVAGTMAGVMLQVLGEKALHATYPPAVGVQLNAKEDYVSYISTLPVTAFILLLVNYIICTTIAGAIATLIPDHDTKRPALITGIIITLGAIFNAMFMPFQPMWVSAMSIIVMIPSALLGYIVGRSMRQRKTSIPSSR
ncbi:hypothetical protein GCM10023093_03240 [Nemorincola caseinilytica]|uniref:Uncharacterized protein n=1 Tax=Nemorincola caseinilytica TaxID=2054315 RepID=A0ABP8N358_9BACT